MILVDTDVWIDFFCDAEPGAQAVTRLLKERRAAWSVVSVFELFCGATRRRQIEELEVLLSRINPVPLSAVAARGAAEQYVRLRRQGKSVGNQDLLIGATAQELEIPVLTRNQEHFGRIDGLQLLSPEELLAE
jgi:tRNA(fMet)-specific endonuclease VapC